jgi:regulator of protease activity HflC (stomatin/prohibitin superfamily)
VRTVEIGLRRAAPAAASDSTPIEWNTPHYPEASQRTDEESLLLTGDQSLIELAATVQYRIADVRAYRLHSADPDGLLQSLAEGAIREAVAVRPLLAERGEDAAELLTGGRGDLEESIRDRLQARANALQLGIEILPRGVCLQDVHPPLDVVPAFRDVSSAFKEKERMKNEADAYHRELLIHAAGVTAWQALAAADSKVDAKLWSGLRPELAGEAAAEINLAEAFAVEQQALAEGDAKQFLAKQAAQDGDSHLTQWRLFLEAIGEALSGKRKLILDPQGGGRRHLLLGLPKESPQQVLPLLDPNAIEREE